MHSVIPPTLGYSPKATFADELLSWGVGTLRLLEYYATISIIFIGGLVKIFEVELLRNVGCLDAHFRLDTSACMCQSLKCLLSAKTHFYDPYFLKTIYYRICMKTAAGIIAKGRRWSGVQIMIINSKKGEVGGKRVGEDILEGQQKWGVVAVGRFGGELAGGGVGWRG
jgi:hypothetical protein